MVIFSIIQFVANGWRVVLWWRFVCGASSASMCVGAVISFAVMRSSRSCPTRQRSISARPDAVPGRGCCRRGARPNIEWRGVPFFTGVLTTVIQLLTGVGGLFLDIFFQKSMLDRKTTIATKAVTQTFSHVVRAVYFGSFVGHRRCVPLWTFVPAIAALDRRHLAGRARARAHDRCRLSPMDAARHLRGQLVYLARGVMLFGMSRRPRSAWSQQSEEKS